MNTNASETVNIAERFLLGDLIKVLIQQIKDMQVSWSMIPEKEQQKVIDKITEKTTEAVRQVVKIIAADSRPALLAEVDSVMFKDGIKAVLMVNKEAADRLSLADATGTSVLIVLPNTAKHLGGDAPVPDPDQPALNGF